MGLEIVIPTVRQASPERLVWALTKGTVKPDRVTIVSNEFDTVGLKGINYGFPVRVLRFSSATVAYGYKDVALRTNLGVWFAESPIAMVQSDDQIPSETMIEDTLRLMAEGRPYIWGHHRFLDFNRYRPGEIPGLPASAGTPRENPIPPAKHGWQSCYSGMLAIETDFFRDVEGIDMAFNCRHAGEDQHLGKRLMLLDHDDHVLIHEPPFAFIDTAEPEPWRATKTNICDHHDLDLRVIGGAPFQYCGLCPYQVYDGEEAALFEDRVLIPFDPSAFEVTFDA